MSNQIVITSGAKLRDLDDVIVATDGILSSVAFNVANGVPRLDENGKILVSQLPNSVMEFKGVWNAATNTPTLANGTGSAGDVWLCNVAGTVNFGAGPIAFAVGDYAVYTGSEWARSSGATGTVTSVGVSRDGNALAITGSPVTTSGVINLGFSGDNTQYINGAGNLTTFPSLTGYVPYTGATTNVNLGTHTLQTARIGIGTAPNSTVTLDVHRAGTIVSRIENTNADQDTLFAYASNGDNVWFNGIDYDGGNYNFGFYYSPDGTNVYRKAYFNNAGDLTAYSFIKIGGTSSQFLKADGSVDSNTYALDADVVHLTGNETIGGTKTFSNATKNDGGILLKNGASYSLSGYMNLGGMTNGLRFTSGLGITNYFSLPSATGYTYTFPSASGTVALTSDISYPVTSVFGRTGAVVATEGDYTLTQIGDVTITSPTTGQVLKYNGTTWINDTDANTGTVTSVAMTVPTGLSIAGSPITSSGTLAVTFASGYSIPTNASQTTWDTAYTNRITSLTTTGSSGAATLISNVLNIPNYGSALSGYLPLTGGTLTGPLSISSTTNSMFNLINPTNGVNIDLVGFANSITYPQARIQLDDDGTYGGILRFFTKPTGSGTNALVQAFNIGSNQRVTFLSGVYISSGSLYLPASITSRTSQIEFANSASYTLLGMPNLTSTFYLRYGTDSIYFENDSGGVILTLNKTATAVFNSSITASSLIKSGGTSSQFLKADGSVDSSTYLTTSSAASTYVPYTGATASVNLGAYSIQAGGTITTGRTTSDVGGSFIMNIGNGSNNVGNANSTTIYSDSAGRIILMYKNATQSKVIGLSASIDNTQTYLQWPSSDGQIALVSQIPSLSGYLPLTGGTLTGPLTINTTTNNQLNLVNSAGAINITLSGFGNGLTYPQAQIKLDDSGSYGGLLKFYTKPSGAVTNALVLALTISDSQTATFTSSVTANGIQSNYISGSLPAQFKLYDGNGGTDAKYWYAESRGTGGVDKYYSISSVNDAQNSISYGMRIHATNNTVNQILFPNGDMSIGSSTTASGEKLRITQSGSNYFVNMVQGISSLFSVQAAGTSINDGYGIMSVGNNGYDRIILNGSGNSSITSNPTFSSTGNYGLNISHTIAPTSSTFNNGGTWAASNNYQQINWSSSGTTLNTGAVIAGFNAINRNQFTASGVSISVSQAGTGIRAISAFQILQQTGGTYAGTISHGASMFIQGIYPTNTVTTTFTNYYGLLINALDEWQGSLPYISITNRYGIYQAGASDKNYLASTLAIGNTSDAGYKLRLEGSNTIHLTASGGDPRIDFSSYGVSTSYPQARIMMPDAGYYGGYLDFYTKINGASTNGLVLALRIKDDGALVKTDSAGGVVYAFSITPYGTGNALANKVSTTAGWDHFYFQNPNGNVGAISTNGSNTTYATSSDYRLKEDLKDFDALELLKSLKTYNFKWKNSNDRMFGLMAHELQSILPYAVVGKKDDIYADGSIKSQSVDYSLLGPILLKAIQQLEAKIENLKTV
jgi:hypothetical protein